MKLMISFSVLQGFCGWFEVEQKSSPKGFEAILEERRLRGQAGANSPKGGPNILPRHRIFVFSNVFCGGSPRPVGANECINIQRG